MNRATAEKGILGFRLKRKIITKIFSLKVHGGEKKNLPGQGRHLINSGFDGELASWIRQERALKGCCTQSVMLARAKVLAQRYDVGINVSFSFKR